MNGQETQALWEMGRDAWNEWAAQVLKSKANFAERGSLSFNWFGDGENDETRLWLKVAVADFSNMTFEYESGFDGYIFPGPALFTNSVFERPASFSGADFQLSANFTRVQFHQDVAFKGTRFAGQALFEETAFDGLADFERAEFLKEKNGPLSHGAKFQRARFSGRTDFRSARFTGSTDFIKTQFTSQTRFDATRFQADITFEGAIFSAPASFVSAEMAGTATFSEAQFSGEGRFNEAVFKGIAKFDRAQFWGDANFRDARFEAAASFSDMRIEGKSRFNDAKFAAAANFLEARFGGDVSFAKADFAGPAIFHACHIGHEGSWIACRFLDNADFTNAVAGRSVSFKETVFDREAAFAQARFEGPVSFASVTFEHSADFSAVQSKVAFVLADASFRNVPGFLEASFHEPPRVDNMSVLDPLKRFAGWKAAGVRDPRPLIFKLMKVCSDPDASAKFRRLKKLAFEAQDQTREQEFFAQELRCRRFWHDKPFGHGIARFWLGWLYGGVANFGRSLLRPVLLWAASIAGFSAIYLGQRAGSILEQGAASLPQAKASFASLFPLATNAQCVAVQSHPVGEALYLSLRNALLRIDWNDVSTARRVFGCLYGVEANGYPVIPLSVSTISLIQGLVSGALIFMFLLALRNLLKVR